MTHISSESNIESNEDTLESTYKFYQSVDRLSLSMAVLVIISALVSLACITALLIGQMIPALVSALLAIVSILVTIRTKKRIIKMKEVPLLTLSLVNTLNTDIADTLKQPQCADISILDNQYVNPKTDAIPTADHSQSICDSQQARAVASTETNFNIHNTLPLYTVLLSNGVILHTNEITKLSMTADLGALGSKFSKYTNMETAVTLPPPEKLVTDIFITIGEDFYKIPEVKFTTTLMSILVHMTQCEYIVMYNLGCEMAKMKFDLRNAPIPKPPIK